MSSDLPVDAPNVFLASLLSEEDRFTSHLAWLLDMQPEIGQAMVDVIAAKSGLEDLAFQAAVDHPWGREFGQENRPDFLFRCASLDVFSEHKVDAGLGDAQLERYLKVIASRGRPSSLVLITRQATPVPQVVAESAHWLRNREREEGHFLWADFFDVIANARGRHASEFAVYMAALGMRPVRWGPWGDPFHHETAREQWRSLWEPVLASLRGPGRVVKRDPKGLGAQIQNPMPGISLAWVGAESRLAPADERVPGPVLSLRVYLGPGEPELPEVDGTVARGQDGCCVHVRTRPIVTTLSSGSSCRREYFADFSRFLRDEIDDARQLLSWFIDCCLADLRRSRGHPISTE